jgi:hypothetical protein
MLWVTRHKPHVDRLACAWLIKRFIDKDAVFEFIERQDPIPKDAIGFTLPKADINPIEGKKTTFDALIDNFHVNDPIVPRIREMVRDYEFQENHPEKMHLKESLGLCYVLKGLEKTSRTDQETLAKGFIVMDAIYATLKGSAEKNAPSTRDVGSAKP